MPYAKLLPFTACFNLQINVVPFIWKFISFQNPGQLFRRPCIFLLNFHKTIYSSLRIQTTVKSRFKFIGHDHTIPADLQSAEDEKMQRWCRSARGGELRKQSAKDVLSSLGLLATPLITADRLLLIVSDVILQRSNLLSCENGLYSSVILHYWPTSYQTINSPTV